MNSYPDIINKFHSALPAMRNWLDNLLETNRDGAVQVINLNFHKIQRVFPAELLTKTRVVTVTNKVPIPPFSNMGLHEFAEFEHMDMAGITYKDLLFIKQTCRTEESLYFHELVHVVQWDKLGIDNFLMAYGVGLLQFGYEDCPLEKMAYTLQRMFDSNALPPMIDNLIRQQTDKIWSQIIQI